MLLNFFYNLFFPLVFLFFLPGLVVKLIRRPGRKKNYPERFAIFSREKKERLKALDHPVWMHAVSVGETNLALTALQAWKKIDPERRFVLSTTTTTAQEIARQKVPDGVEVIFCPIDFLPFVRKTFRLIRPSGLVVFETEIWPNLVRTAKKLGLPTALVNARMSDHSLKGYRRFRMFFAPVLRCFDAICVQTGADRDRYRMIAPDLEDRIVVGGNIKFDQRLPENFRIPDLIKIFPSGGSPVIIGASTHSGEEKMIVGAFRKLREQYKGALLILVPRHAERGAEIAELLKSAGMSFLRRSTGERFGEGPVDCLLADTTGELMGFLAASDTEHHRTRGAGQGDRLRT